MARSQNLRIGGIFQRHWGGVYSFLEKNFFKYRITNKFDRYNGGIKHISYLSCPALLESEKKGYTIIQQLSSLVGASHAAILPQLS